MIPDTGCERFRGLLAEEAVGGLDAGLGGELQAHLVGCPSCRADADEVSRAVGALAWVGPVAAAELARPGAAGPGIVTTGDLDAAVAGILARGRQTESGVPAAAAPEAGAPEGEGSRTPTSRRRRRVLVPLASVAAAGLLVWGAVALAGHGGTTTRTVALSGPGGSRAVAQLTAVAWGTSVTIDAPAGPTGQVLTVSMSSGYGTWWNAGSYRETPSHGATVVLACALPIDRIRTIEVSDAGGHVVLAGGWSSEPSTG